jgi:glutamine synthetase
MAQGSREARPAEPEEHGRCLPVIIRKDSIDLFTKYKVYSERELQSRYDHLLRELRQDGEHRGGLMVTMARR